MQKIKLKKGLEIIIDAHLLEEVSKYEWRVSNKNYVFRKCRKKYILLHRFIMGNPPLNFEVDHINGNPLDNRICNLRVCKHSENLRNQKTPKNNRSGYKGVMLYKRTSKWRAYIRLNGKQIHLGYFDTKEEAAMEYNKMALIYFGQYARLNKI